jgi:hypothetical protein
MSDIDTAIDSIVNPKRAPLKPLPDQRTFIGRGLKIADIPRDENGFYRPKDLWSRLVAIACELPPNFEGVTELRKAVLAKADLRTEVEWRFELVLKHWQRNSFLNPVALYQLGRANKSRFYKPKEIPGAMFVLYTTDGLRQSIADRIGCTVEDLWPFEPEPEPEVQPNVSPAMESAKALLVAIDALPVGKDIRNRLNGHVTAHIADIEALAR